MSDAEMDKVTAGYGATPYPNGRSTYVIPTVLSVTARAASKARDRKGGIPASQPGFFVPYIDARD
jgi:hypothetical protein